MEQTFIGIEIGGTKMQIVTGNERGEINVRFKLPVDRARGAEGIRG